MPEEPERAWMALEVERVTVGPEGRVTITVQVDLEVKPTDTTGSLADRAAGIALHELRRLGQDLPRHPEAWVLTRVRSANPERARPDRREYAQTPAPREE